MGSNYFCWEGPTTIIESNCLATSMACPNAFWTLIGLGQQPHLQEACTVFHHSLSKEMHPNVQSEPPLAQLWTIPTCPITGSTLPSLLSLLRELWRAMTLPLSLFLSNTTNSKSLAAQSFHTFISPKLLCNLLMGVGKALGRAGSQHTQTQPRLQVHIQNKPFLV